MHVFLHAYELCYAGTKVEKYMRNINNGICELIDLFGEAWFVDDEDPVIQYELARRKRARLY